MECDIDKIKTIKEEYLRLTKTFQHLKELASVDLDLLFLSVDVGKFPKVKNELDKIRELVQVLIKEPQFDLEIGILDLFLCGKQAKILAQHKTSDDGGDVEDGDTGIKECTNAWNDNQNEGLVVRKTESIDHYVATLTSVFAKQEVINAFRRLLGETSMKVVNPFKAMQAIDTNDETQWLRGDMENKPFYPELFDNCDNDDTKRTDPQFTAVNEITQVLPRGAEATSRLLEQASYKELNPIKVESTYDDEYYSMSQTLQEPSNVNNVMHSIYLERKRTSVDDESRRDVANTSINQKERYVDDDVHNILQGTSGDSYDTTTEIMRETMPHQASRILNLNHENRSQKEELSFLTHEHQENAGLEHGKAFKSIPSIPEENSTPNVNTESSTSKTNDNNTPQICLVCGKELKNKNTLRGHLKRHKIMEKQSENALYLRGENECVGLSAEGSSFVSDNGGRSLTNNLETEQQLKSPKNKGPHTCTICGQVLKSKYILQKHVLRHKENAFNQMLKQVTLGVCEENDSKSLSHEARFVCDQCGMSLTNEWELKQHVKTHRNKPQTCTLCNKEFKNKECLQDHLKLHREKEKKEILKCPVCSKEFRIKKYLRNHMKWHWKEKPFMCDVCGKRFRVKTALTTHKTSVHLKIRKECDVCRKSFSSDRSLQRHRILHQVVKPYKCSLCDKAYNSSDARNAHMRTHTGNYPHYCSTCGKGFNSPQNLLRHEQIHSRERPFICCVCGKSYLSESLAKAHEESQSPTGTHICFKENFHCTLCKKGFRLSNLLALHVLSSHNEELDHCPLCKNKEKFDSFADLKSHLTSIHLKEKPFKCSVCGEKFYTYYRLLAHRALHKDKNALKCSDCGKSYSCARGLKLHILSIHNLVTHQCDICGKQFSRKSALMAHRHRHSGVKEYSCSVCGRNFATRYSLKLHSWTHRTDKRFQCDKCERGFNDKRNLSSHIKRSHPEMFDSH